MSKLSKSAARPIRLDRGTIRKIAERLVADLKRKAKGREQELVGNHSRPIVEESIVIDNVLGDLVLVKILILADADRRASFVRGGSIGRHRQTGQTYVFITLNGAHTWSALSEDYMVRKMLPVLMHELTHAADIRPKTPNRVQKMVAQESDFDLKEYYNDPKEVRAYMREIFEEIRKNVFMVMDSSLGSEWGLRKNIEIHLKNNLTWEQIEPHLTPANRKRILKGIVTALQDEMPNQRTASSFSKTARFVFNEKVLNQWKSDLRRMTKIYRDVPTDPPREWKYGGYVDNPNYEKSLRNWEEARKLFVIYGRNIHDLVYEEMLLDFDKENTWQEGALRKEAWSFLMDITGPTLFPRSYDYRTKEHEPDLPKLGKIRDAKVRKYQKSARKFFEALEDWLALKGGSHSSNRVEQMNLAGFQVRLYDATGSERNIDFVKAGLEKYRKQAQKYAPILLKHQVPINIYPNKSNREAEASYNSGTKTISLWDWATFSSGSVSRLVWVLAHEMGHHIFKHVLNSRQRELWETVIEGDYGDLDLRTIVDRMRPGEKVFDFITRLEKEDPLLMFSLESLWDNPRFKSLDLISVRSIIKYVEGGGNPIVQVPSTPISGYASKNPEEAFCEALGILVGLGPNGVHQKIRALLRIMIPDLRIASSKKSAGTEDEDNSRSRTLLASDNVPMNPKLWEKVQKLTKGEVKSIRHDGKTINGPNDGKGFKIFPCVPMHSQALTRSGWKGYDEIQVGEEIVGYCRDTDTLRWTPVLHLHHHEEAPIMRIYKAQTNFDFLCTPDHKWVINHAPRVGSSDRELRTRKYENRLVRAADITKSMNLVSGARMEGGENLSLHDFHKTDWSWVEKVLNMSESQREAFFASAIVFDGHQISYSDRLKRSRYGFSQKCVDHGQAVEICGALLGYSVTFREKKCNPEMMSWTFIDRQTQKTHNVLKEDAGVSEVWCPETGLGTWLMKQGNMIHVTGNSAYANGWAAKVYKELGGKWKKEARHIMARGNAKKDVGKGGLDEWFSGHGNDEGDATWGDWVAISPVKKKIDDKTYEPGDIVGPCGISSEDGWKDITNNGKDPLKCMPRNKAYDMPKADRADLAKEKMKSEKKDSNRGKKPTHTPTFSEKAKEITKKAFAPIPDEFRDLWRDSKFKDSAYVGLSLWLGEGYVLDPSKGGGEYGIYVTPLLRYARLYGSKVHECLVSIRKPLVVEGKYEISPRDLTKSDIDELKSQGYDSIVVTNSTIDRASEFVLFDRRQVWVLHAKGGPLDFTS